MDPDVAHGWLVKVYHWLCMGLGFISIIALESGSAKARWIARLASLIMAAGAAAALLGA